MARIVLVEDTPHAQQLMIYLLEAYGHTVMTASTGAAGLAMIRKEQPDLSLFDIQLPDIDGYELVSQVRADPALAHLPVIAVTANAMLGDRNQALASGFDGYISKPIDPASFNQMVNTYLPIALRGHDQARSTRQRSESHTMTIGIVAPYVGRWYFTEVFGGIEEGLQAFDVNMLLHSAGSDSSAGTNRVRVPNRLSGKVDGVLVISLQADDPKLAGLFDLHVPVVMLGYVAKDLPSVAIDDEDAAQTAVQHLVDQGHERIALIAGEPQSKFVSENKRLNGYLTVLAANSLPDDPRMRENGEFTVRGGEQAMLRLLDLNPRPTAVFCMSDEMAFGAIRALERRGLEVGTEVAVVGFDGHDLAEAFDLSTIVQPVRTLGLLATRLLMSHTVDPTGALATIVPTSLVVRGSSQKKM